ncbi:MAG: hypothetical protein ACPHK8_05155 [Thermoplasmatota archaeon]
MARKGFKKFGRRAGQGTPWFLLAIALVALSFMQWGPGSGDEPNQAVAERCGTNNFIERILGEPTECIENLLGVQSMNHVTFTYTDDWQALYESLSLPFGEEYEAESLATGANTFRVQVLNSEGKTVFEETTSRDDAGILRLTYLDLPGEDTVRIIEPTKTWEFVVS